MAVLAIQQAVFFDSSAYIAAKEGNLTKIEEFIQQGGWVDMPNKKGNSMLYYACKHEHIKVVKYLMDHGAHRYYNLAKKDGLEKTTKEFKKFQMELEKSRKEKAGSIHLLEHVIDEKTATFTCIKEGLQFINSIPISSSREQSLKAYSQHLAFDSEEALSILNYVEGEAKTIVEKELIRAFLACGDIASANYVVEQVTSKDGTSRFLKIQVEIFSTMYHAVEKRCQEYPSEITKSIYHGLNQLNSSTQFPPETVASIIKGMSECNSFTKALEYANKLVGKGQRGFARYGLSYSGLEGLAIAATKSAEMIYAEHMEKSKENIIEAYLKKAQESKDFSEVLNFIAEIEDDYYYADVGFSMCLVGKYDEAYQLIKKHCEPLEGFDEIIQEFIRFLRVVSEDWVERFSQLTVKHV